MGRTYIRSADVFPGKVFGNKTILRDISPGTPRNLNERRFLCRCSCGKEIEVNWPTLRDSQGCVYCGVGGPGVPRPTRRKFTQIGELTSTHWNNVLHGASLRSIPVEITLAEAWAQFESQQGLCALTGLLLEFGPVSRRVRGVAQPERTTASLDRIDNNKGYVGGNIQWVHKDINRMKREFAQDRFIELCLQVATHLGPRAPVEPVPA